MKLRDLVAVLDSEITWRAVSSMDEALDGYGHYVSLTPDKGSVIFDYLLDFPVSCIQTREDENDIYDLFIWLKRD